jgi:hypothetical protein
MAMSGSIGFVALPMPPVVVHAAAIRQDEIASFRGIHAAPAAEPDEQIRTHTPARRRRIDPHPQYWEFVPHLIVDRDVQVRAASRKEYGAGGMSCCGDAGGSVTSSTCFCPEIARQHADLLQCVVGRRRSVCGGCESEGRWSASVSGAFDGSGGGKGNSNMLPSCG